jgi:DNA-binding transcriptional ArsR family regulator
MKPTKTITDPEAFQLLADETRRKMMFLLRVKEMTVSQIAKELGITPQAIYHHIKKLLNGGIVEVVREERLGHLIESYYMTTAETFNFSMGGTESKKPQSQKLVKEQEIATLNALKKLGFKIEFNENKVSELVAVKSEMEECCSSAKFEDAIAGIEDLDFPTKLLVGDYAKIISMSDREFTKREEISRKQRDLLRSLVKK